VSINRRVSKEDIFEHAEQVIDGRPISADLNARIGVAAAYREELQAAKATLALCEAAPAIEPTESSTDAILRLAALERSRQARRHERFSTVRAMGVGMSYAAGLAVVAVSLFAIASSDDARRGETGLQPSVFSRLTATHAAPQDLQRVSAEIETLAGAVGRRTAAAPATAEEREHRRTVEFLENELNTALAAFQRNPGNMRAQAVIQANMERTRETLHSIYREQSY
jgi:hypothetical protein